MKQGQKMSEIIVKEDALIATKTDLEGLVTYASEDFLTYSEMQMGDVLFKPHNIVRHPDMPHSTFKMMWDYLKQGREYFAFVKNRTKNDNFYWCFVNVTPSFSADGETLGYYAVRRAPNREILPRVEELYKKIRTIEEKTGGNKGMEAGVQFLEGLAKEQNISFNNYIFNLQFGKDAK